MGANERERLQMEEQREKEWRWADEQDEAALNTRTRRGLSALNLVDLAGTSPLGGSAPAAACCCESSETSRLNASSCWLSARRS